MPAEASSVSFDYSGPDSGRYTAAGTPREDGGIGGSFAVAYARNGLIQIHAFQAIGGTVGHRLILLVPATVGTHPAYTNFWGYFGMDAAVKGVPSGVPAFFLRHGSIVVTEVTATRARGTFSGTGFIGLTGSSEASDFAVENGRFDVELRPYPVDY